MIMCSVALFVICNTGEMVTSPILTVTSINLIMLLPYESTTKTHYCTNIVYIQRVFKKILLSSDARH